MKAALPILLAALAAPPPAAAETVFRCTENGKTTFTEIAHGPACQPMDLKVIEADPREATRQNRETRLWNEQRESQVQRMLDRESSTETQRRKSELEALSTGRGRRGDSRHGYARSGLDRGVSGISKPTQSPAPAPDRIGSDGRK